MTIKSISLNGFQVFSTPTTIPLEPLTLLYGPNSAGKSAVEDALHLIRKIVEAYSDKTKTNNEFYTSLPVALIKKSWRRISDEPLKIVEKMEISLKLNSGLHIGWVFNSDSGRPLWFDDFTNFNNCCLCDLRIELDGALLISLIDTESTCSINFNHPSLSKVGIPRKISKAVKNYPKIFSLIGGTLVLSNALQERIGLGLDNQWNIHTQERQVHIQDKEGQIRIENIEVTPPDLLAVLHDFKQIFDGLLATYMSHTFWNNDDVETVVPASRHVPGPAELVYLFHKCAPDSELAEFDLMTNGLSEIEPLARAFGASNTSLHEDYFLNSIPDMDLVKNVNNSLTNDLFVERGYRVGFDHRLLVKGEEGPDGLLIRLLLLDSEGRRFNFTEVGSGLGYILPVLVAIWQNPDLPKVGLQLLIQQPELHLHPALQANLGDIFIDAVNRSGRDRIIVETHSEHLLLRILKRIRQTTAGTQPPEYNIRPEQISVLYFVPSSDGSTKVQRLRISPDGDFIDKWPNGFFSERDKDLFDE